MSERKIIHKVELSKAGATLVVKSAAIPEGVQKRIENSLRYGKQAASGETPKKK